MQEGNVQTLGTLAGLLVNEANSLTVTLYEGFLHAILYAECNVVYALVTFVEPLLDGAIGACRLQQFQLYLATFQESSLYFLVFYYFCCITLQAQHLSEVG